MVVNLNFFLNVGHGAQILRPLANTVWRGFKTDFACQEGRFGDIFSSENDNFFNHFCPLRGKIWIFWQKFWAFFLISAFYVSKGKFQAIFFRKQTLFFIFWHSAEISMAKTFPQSFEICTFDSQKKSMIQNKLRLKKIFIIFELSAKFCRFDQNILASIP